MELYYDIQQRNHLTPHILGENIAGLDHNHMLRVKGMEFDQTRQMQTQV